ncbi:MAG: hypothetical protein CMK06_02945 [Ponticaulis sp.]|nr:hypothetical protein [Ponticaulis sp.]
MRSIFLMTLGALALTACGGPAETPEATASEVASTPLSADAFGVSDAYVRQPFGGQTTTAAYFLLSSTADRDAEIVGVSADKAGTAELHQHIMSDGMMKMRRVEKVSVPANGSVEFSSGGYHVMMFNVTDPLEAGNVVEITLDIASGGDTMEISFPATVRAPG